MRTIQEVGLEIMTNQPRRLYIMGGIEYGIKCKYLEILKAHYENRLIEASSMNYIINLFSRRQLFPVPDSVYVVRYDEEFVSGLSSSTSKLMDSLNIHGTVVCIYQDEKHLKKLDKYLPEYTVAINNVSPQYLKQYLISDFPALDSKYIDSAVKWAIDYNQAKIMCQSLVNLPHDKKASDLDIASLFGKSNQSTESAFRIGIASRNFRYLLDVIDEYEGDYNNLIYTALSTMIDVDRCLDSRSGDPKIGKYIKLWTREDIYYMFTNCYSLLRLSRSISINDMKNLICNMCSMVQFSPIPECEVK